MKTTPVTTLKFAFILFCIFANSTSVFSAEGRKIYGIIKKDSVLKAGEYTIDNNLKVSADATLRIEAGAKLYFMPGTKIIVEGGLIVSGTSNSKVLFTTSTGVEDYGDGLMISGVSNKQVEIKYAEFTKLNKAIELHKDWFRPEVSIHHNNFNNLMGSEGVIVFRKRSLFDETNNTATVNFNDNVFHHNSSGILLAEVEASKAQTNFERNVITQNYIYGSDNSGFANSPLQIIFNEQQAERSISIENNSISNNYIVSNEADTVIKVRNISISGEAESLNIGENYLGSDNIDAVNKTLYHFAQDINSPFLNIKSLQATPSSSLPFHIFKIDMKRDNSSRNYGLTFNKKIDLDKSGIKGQGTNNGTYSVSALDASAYTLLVSVNDASTGTSTNKLSGFYDGEGNEAPYFELHKSKINKINAKDVVSGSMIVDSTQLKVDRIDANTNGIMPVLNEIRLATAGESIKDFKKFDEIGLFLGACTYFGDLRPTSEIFDLKYYSGGAGIMYRKNLHPRYSWTTNLTYGELLAPKDYYGRKYYFTSDLVELRSTVDFYLFPNVNNKNIRLIPSLGVGISIFYFNPMAYYRGKKVALADYETNGYKYSNFSFGVPIVFNLKRIIDENMTVNFTFSYCYTFTDNLDDVSGTGTYQTLKFDSKGRAEAKGYLSNAGSTQKKGLRARGKATDAYLFFGITIATRFDNNTWARLNPFSKKKQF